MNHLLIATNIQKITIVSIDKKATFKAQATYKKRDAQYLVNQAIRYTVTMCVI